MIVDDTGILLDIASGNDCYIAIRCYHLMIIEIVSFPISMVMFHSQLCEISRGLKGRSQVRPWHINQLWQPWFPSQAMSWCRNLPTLVSCLADR